MANLRGKLNQNWRALMVLVALTLVVAYSSCGSDPEFNLWQPFTEDSALENNNDARLEEARVRMDDGDYKGAANLLDPVITDSDRDSNDARLLYAAAKLGESELDVWTIVTNIFDSLDSDTFSGDGGLGDIIDSFTETFLGTGEERDEKVAALETALDTLQTAPDQNDRRITNTACLFAGFLAVPTIADAEEDMRTALTNLETIRDSATSGGADCPDISLLDDSITLLNNATTNINNIIDAASNCSFLNLGETQDLANSVEQALDSLIGTADQGCATIECPASLPDCTSLFPTCVQEVLEVGADNPAVAGDGEIAACELIIHCTDSTSCFL